MDYTKTLVMACATVIEEMLPLLPPGMQHQVFDFGLHVNPERLRRTLQAAIDAVGEPFNTIILGYGLCSQAVIGISSQRCTLVVPRVDDCIAIFLGSRSAYKEQSQAEPGTYYLTKGWIEVGDTPFAEHDRMIQRYGKERAERMIQLMLANYKRLALIDTGQYELERYREYARRTAERFNLRFEEIEGSNALVKKMIYGPWDDEFVVAPPGETIQYEHFFRSQQKSS
jgi:hypothetical protein